MSEVFLITYNPTTDEETLTMDKATAIKSAYNLSELLLRCGIKMNFFTGHLVGSQGKVLPFNKLKVNNN
jgi:hypothetical protein